MDIKIKIEIGHTLASIIMALCCQDSERLQKAADALKQHSDALKAAVDAGSPKVV